MQFTNRTRAAAHRVFSHTASFTASWRMPVGALPLAIATLVLVAVPIARAAGGNQAATTKSAEGAAPVATEAARTPKIKARLVRSRATGSSAIKVRAVASRIGHGKAHVRFAVRASGTRAWRTVDSDNVRAGRTVTLSWRGRPGRYMTRVSVRKFGHTATDRTGRAFVFRRSFASYYGPGLYGGALACGGRLTPSTIGVAHKTLPCGTKVAFRVGGRVVTARVVDRGPYVAGRDWDLTSGLKHRLGFGSTGVVYATR